MTRTGRGVASMRGFLADTIDRLVTASQPTHVIAYIRINRRRVNKPTN
ncbi:MAG TPA: hypothetical protein VFO99_09025 [Pyrinomonadaceae bacterium]|nr:hypothetical protein [Pyrinomonadaceae bacterium]